MALHFNYSKCASAEALTIPGQWEITEHLIWLTLSIGINDITEATASEVAERAHMFWAATGFGLDGSGVNAERAITLAEITRRIGLHTNAATMTKAAFNHNLIRIMREEAHRQLREQQRAAAARSALGIEH
jgi:hypothetical protein